MNNHYIGFNGKTRGSCGDDESYVQTSISISFSVDLDNKYSQHSVSMVTGRSFFSLLCNLIFPLLIHFSPACNRLHRHRFYFSKSDDSEKLHFQFVEKYGMKAYCHGNAFRITCCSLLVAQRLKKTCSRSNLI